MRGNYAGGKRQREAERDRKKKEKQERLRQNRAMRAQGIEPDAEAPAEPPSNLPEVPLDQIVIGVAPRPRKTNEGPVKLFVGGLSWDTTSDDLRAAFAKFGPISDAMVIADRATGRSRGFGFVTFENYPDSVEAIKAMNGAELDGRTLKVNIAEGR
jgi:RNA recognition motif-containing protein